MNPSFKEINHSQLLKSAKEVLTRSYSPYSKFPVAAALLTLNGNIVVGVNIENASYGLTICAERVAVFRSISEGYQGFRAIAIVSQRGGFCPPCGACRQVLLEFAEITSEVILEDQEGKPIIINVMDLLPQAFGPNDLK